MAPCITTFQDKAEIAVVAGCIAECKCSRGCVFFLKGLLQACHLRPECKIFFFYIKNVCGLAIFRLIPHTLAAEVVSKQRDRKEMINVRCKSWKSSQEDVNRARM